jgi:hypothetical protein
MVVQIDENHARRGFGCLQQFRFLADELHADAHALGRSGDLCREKEILDCCEKTKFLFLDRCLLGERGTGAPGIAL